MNEEKLRQLFRNNSDCYADTHTIEDGILIDEGDVIQAITEDKFIELINTFKNAIILKEFITDDEEAEKYINGRYADDFIKKSEAKAHFIYGMKRALEMMQGN